MTTGHHSPLEWALAKENRAEEDRVFAALMWGGVEECSIEQRRRDDMAFIEAHKAGLAPSNEYIFGCAQQPIRALKAMVSITSEYVKRELFLDSITATSFYDRGFE